MLQRCICCTCRNVKQSAFPTQPTGYSCFIRMSKMTCRSTKKSKQFKSLSDEHRGADGGHDGPPTGVLEQEAHASAGIRVLVAARGGGAVGQRAVDEDGVVGDHDLCLVQLVVAAVADQLVEHGRGGVAAVVVAPALDVRVAGALHGLGLVAAAAVVVVAVGVAVGVEVRAVRPREERIEGKGSEAGAEEEGGDAGRRDAARAIWLSRAAGVV